MAPTNAIDDNYDTSYASHQGITMNPWIEVELTEPVVMSGLELALYNGGCKNVWKNVHIRVANESSNLQPRDKAEVPETHGNLALIINQVKYFTKLPSIQSWGSVFNSSRQL